MKRYAWFSGFICLDTSRRLSVNDMIETFLACVASVHLSTKVSTYKTKLQFLVSVTCSQLHPWRDRVNTMHVGHVSPETVDCIHTFLVPTGDVDSPSPMMRQNVNRFPSQLFMLRAALFITISVSEISSDRNHVHH